MNRILDVDDYQIYLNIPLGSGTNGNVYHCSNKKGEIFVAKVKKCIIFLIAEIEDDERVQNEIKILEVIKNSGNINLVGIQHLKIQESKFIQILEKCETNLSVHLNKKKKFTGEQAIDFLNQIVNGYRTFFEKNILHRDIKPQNILIQTINDKIFFKMCDFGISKTLECTKDNLITQIGTPLYLAPEINRNYDQDKQLKCEFQELVQKDIKEASKCDIFSIGILMYQVIFGEVPQAKYRNQIDEFYKELKYKKFELDVDVNPKLCQLVKRMIEYQPSERIRFDEVLKNPLITQYNHSNPIQNGLPSIFITPLVSSKISSSQVNQQSKSQFSSQTSQFQIQSQFGQTPFIQSFVASQTTQVGINLINSQQEQSSSLSIGTNVQGEQNSFDLQKMPPYNPNIKNNQSLPSNQIQLNCQKIIAPFPNLSQINEQKFEVQNQKKMDEKAETPFRYSSLSNNNIYLIQKRVKNYFENILYQTQKMIKRQSMLAINNFLRILDKEVILINKLTDCERIISQILLQMPERNLLKEKPEYKKIRDDFDQLLNLLEFKIQSYYEDNIIKKVKPNQINDDSQIQLLNDKQEVNRSVILNYFINLLYEAEKMLDGSIVSFLLLPLVQDLKSKERASLELVRKIHCYLPERQQLQETSEYANFRNCFQNHYEWLQSNQP